MIGIIGGTGIYEQKNAEEIRKEVVKTPYGDEPEIKIVSFEGKEVAFLPRHGKSHNVPPHKINYRANIFALKEIGVNRIMTMNSVGSINESFATGDVVIPTDFLDFTKGRESTFYDDKVVHTDFSRPYCPEIRNALIKAADTKAKVFPMGVYACTQGPRFETPAEIKMIKTLGGDIVGMTGVPEVVLAREMEMCYGSLCIVANFASGIKEDRLTATEVTDIVKKNEEMLGEIIMRAVKGIPDTRECECGKALSGAMV
ncbi:S-methyl-5'-thioadenosine phosphorylase [archaeon]|nr:S-methyl-5'-thioadenosine phosphorylase [archaeon]